MNIKDIARIAGVGVSTVSRVLNNHPDVKESTREKVLAVIKDSSYIPNNSARILKQNNTKNIGVLVKGVFNPFFSEMINVIGTKINDAKYTMILQQNDYVLDEEIDTLKAFIKEKRLQGVICLGGNFTYIEESTFNNIDIPIVLTSVSNIFKVGVEKFSSVGIDNVKSSYDATKYLIDLGHENIALMIGDKNDFGISWWRYKGFKKAMEDSKLKFDDKNLLIGNYHTQSAYDVVKEFIEKERDVTAIFAISDFMAIGAAKAIIDLGLEVGKDISIIGFDGMNVSKFYNPGITTIKQPKEEMAKESINLLLRLISSKEKHKHILLDTKLVKRDSCSKNKRR